MIWDLRGGEEETMKRVPCERERRRRRKLGFFFCIHGEGKEDMGVS